jgi:hypothetical protein
VRRIKVDLQTEDEAPKKPKKKAEPKPADDDDIRDNGVELTQEAVDLEELREAMKLVKALPYDGTEAATRLALNKNDIADAEYVSTWMAGLVVQSR